jgi:argininosuccinate lyase
MKLWGGRFSGKRDPLFEKFSESFSVDHRLILYDLRVNQSYVQELGRAGVLTRNEVVRLTKGLEAIGRYVAQRPRWAEKEKSEDVHTWVEARLEREVGEVARKLRTGRSRNDLVATETRMYAKDAIQNLLRSATGLLEALLSQAQKHTGVILPGYTHLQPAQPILFAHYLLAYFEMLMRDISRLVDCFDRADELPMGSGALAGSSYPIDRVRLGSELGFVRVARNSLDATSDRDFVCELLFVCSLILTHLSRLAEDFIIYSSPGFGYIEMGDAYATGSSLMPQKKNADAMELIRAKAARMQGRLAGLLALLKGLPLGYDRDLQEDKSALFESVDTTIDCLTLAGRIVQTLRVYPERMLSGTSQGFLTATEVADELVRRGIPFARAHEQVGELVKHCSQRSKSFAELSVEEARNFIPEWDARLASAAVAPELSVQKKNVLGGTASRQVSRQVKEATKAVSRLKALLRSG